MNLFFETKERLRLDEFLRKELKIAAVKKDTSFVSADFSNSKIRRLILSSSVKVNGKVCVRPSFELRGFSRISVNFDKEKFFYEKEPDDLKFTLTEKNVIYEDDYIICVNKPAFFPVEETIVGNEKRPNLHQEVVRYLWDKDRSLRNPPYAGILHRLDRTTSGAILFSKGRCVNKDFQEMFSSHTIKKTYKCISSIPEIFFSKNSAKLKEGSSFEVEKFMGRISSKSQKGKWGTLSQSEGGQYSKTLFTVQKVQESQVKGRLNIYFSAELFTGRTHQIRVHLSEEGFPILGDELYGGFPSDRIYLHSESLEFIHPISKENMNFFIADEFFL